MTVLTRSTVAVLIAGLMTASFAAPARAETADAAVNALIGELAKGNPKAAWDAMPASYQKDVTELIHTGAGKVDPAVYNKMGALIPAERSSSASSMQATAKASARDSRVCAMTTAP